MKRIIGALAMASLLAVGLTACDPPMPPDVAAQIAEQTFTCEPGNSNVAFPELMADISQGFADSLASDCVDPLPAMTMTVVPAGTPADIEIGDYPATCQALATVPFATEAADLSVYFADGYLVNLSAKTAAKILNGEITNWSDKTIAGENPDTVLPDEPIVVRQSADTNAFHALKAWFDHLGAKITAPLTLTKGQQTFEPLAEGEIAILPHSVGLFNAVTPVNFIVGHDDNGQVLATPDNMGIGSAATQWVPNQDGDNVTVNIDFNKEPLVMSGFDVASTPYGAIYPVNLTVCGADNLTNRANALFLLRLDSQGSLGASSYNQLSEYVRDVALVAVRRGLQIPTPTP